MKIPTVREVRDAFTNNPKQVMWLPTKTRNEFIAEENFTSCPKTIVEGRVYRVEFKSIGGGMWETRLVNL